MIKQIEKHPVISLILFVIILLGFTADAIPVTIMEARNFISAREMLTDDHWILTTMNSEARYQKPPLPTWLTACFGYIFGIKTILALRWPALLLLASIGVSIYYLSKQLQLDKSHRLINGFVVLSSFYVFAIVIEAPWDIYAHGFMLMALLQLFIMFQSKNTNPLRCLLFVLCLAASILSKGPVSLYVLFLSFVIAYGIAYKYKGHLIHFLKLVSLLILGITIGGWWYFYVRIADPSTFTAIAAKETGNWSSYNVRPFYYYWSFFVQSGLWSIPALMSLVYPYMKTRVKHLKAYRFSFMWTIIAVILLSIIPEKKSRYLMPVLIPLALNIGFYVNYILVNYKTLKSNKERIPLQFTFGLIGTIGLLFWSSEFFLGSFFNSNFKIRYLLTSVSLFVLGLFIFQSLKQKTIKKTFYLTLSFIMLLGLLALPLSRLKIQKNYKSIAELTNSKIPLYSFSTIAPEAIYLYGKQIPKLKTKEGIIVPSESEFHLLTSKKFNPKANTTLSKIYTISFIEQYDLNTTEKDKRSYRDRLANQLYLLKRKK